MFLDDVIRAAVRDVMREVLEPIIETDAFQARLAAMIAERSAQHPPIPVAVDGTPAPPSTAWVVGAGPGRRLTEAGLTHLQSLQAAGKHSADIAVEMGISRRAVDLRSGPGASTAASNHSRAAKPEEVIARAKTLFLGGKSTTEIGRALGAPKTTVHGWKKRHGWQRGQPVSRAPTAEPPAAPIPPVSAAPLAPAAAAQKTVAVVPAAEVPAPRQPAAPILLAPTPAPPPKRTPAVITTTTKEVRAWLIAAMKAGGLSLTQAQDRVGFMTHEQALAEANQRRTRAAYPPFALLGSRSAA